MQLLSVHPITHLNSNINHICFITTANEIKAQTITVINESNALFLWAKRGHPHPTGPSLLSFSK